MFPDGTTKCPICCENHLKLTSEFRDIPQLKRHECYRCGTYVLDDYLEGLRPPPWNAVRHYVSGWIRRENIRNGNKNLIICENGALGGTLNDLQSPEWWQDRFENMGFPVTLPEKLDALLISYAEVAGNDYEAQLDPKKPHLISDIGAKNEKEILGLTNILHNLGYIHQEKSGSPRFISAKGWLRFEELKGVTTASNTAFIAMWFNELTKELRETLSTVVLSCGYKPIVLDQEEFNGFIMEQVIIQIKRARFVIADFTCRKESIEANKVKAGVRGGVYWEAGMAYGLNKPVIHTCEDNDESKLRRHFDIDQYNTIFWKPEELTTNIRDLSEKIDNPNFAEKLVNRILFVVGRGGYSQ